MTQLALVNSALFVVTLGLLLCIGPLWSASATTAGSRALRAAFDRTRQLLVIMSADGTITHANQAFLTATGLPESDVVGQLLWDLSNWRGCVDTRRTVRNAVEDAAQGAVASCEAAWNRPDGASVRTRFEITTRRDRDGRVTLLIADGCDVSGQQEADERLRASEARTRILIESAPEAVVVLDVSTGQFVDWNQHACALLGVSSDAMSAHGPDTISPRVQPDGRASADAFSEFVQAAVGGDAPTFQWVHLGPNGRHVPCQVWLAQLPDPSGIRVRCSLMDMTERRRLEEQLGQAQRMDAMGQMAGGVAHDFNNLLMVISGHCSILMGQFPGTDPRHVHLKAISNAAQQAAWLTERLLAFSRRAVQVPKVMNVNTAVRETERMLRRVIREDIQLSVVLDPHAGQVKIDPVQWSQVLMNLAVNARDAMPFGGRLSIRTGRVDVDARFVETHAGLDVGPYVSLSVADSGTGIPEDIRGRIFEPFFTTKDVGQGTGLGLAVVHGIVTQAGGGIDVESAIGRGTTFTIYLPSVNQLPDPLSTDDLPRRVGAGERVLLVEDEPAVRDVVALALREQGFNVLTAGDGATALRIVEAEGHIDLLATDVVMPHMSGRQLADTLEARFPRLRVLFMSGYADDGRLQRGMLGADEEYMQKPFPLAALARKVREMIDRG
ncbi:MAG: ATP-binding protein [Acidobacteriota bacterium]